MLDDSKRTSLFKLKQALLKMGKEENIKKDDVEILEPMPVPSPLKISTITFCYNIGTVNYLNIISRYIPIYDRDSPEVLSEMGQITYAKQIYSLPRGKTDKKPKNKSKSKNKIKNIGDKEEQTTSNTRFPNQVTIDFRYCGIRSISVMIFSNGAIKMAGLLSKVEGEWVAQRITQIIQNIKIKVFKSFNQLPKEGNHNNDFQLVIEKGHIRSYRWITIDDYTSWVPVDTMMPDVIKNIGDGLMPNNYWHDVDLHFGKLCYINKIKEYIDNGVINVSMLTNKIPLPQLYCLQDPTKASVNNLKICMINSDFSFFFYIKSDVLRNLLTDTYKIDASYGVQGYNALKCQYKWNPIYTNGRYPGMCQCDSLCFTTKKSKNKCKIITISVFQNGNAIITGATDLVQLEEAHKFIVNVVKNNYEKLRKKEPYTSRKKVVSGRTNSKNKKRRVILLQKKNINNSESTVPPIVIDYDSDENKENNQDNNQDVNQDVPLKT